MAEPSPNRSYVIRLWATTLVMCGFLGAITIAALLSGDPIRVAIAIAAITLTPVLIFGGRWSRKRRLARLLRSADPLPALRAAAASARRIPHGPLFAASSTATVLALYGRFEEAERELSSVSWDAAPPFVQAQGSAARAVVAYARGEVEDGLDHAVTATQQAMLDIDVPGAKTSELALRTYRNLGLALAGRATETTERELRTAFAQLPHVGRVLAAWGLAAIARSNGSRAELEAMQSFIRETAPHATALLASAAQR
jgi:hypothetical protein